MRKNEQRNEKRQETGLKFKIKSMKKKEGRYLNKRVTANDLEYEFYQYNRTNKVYGIRQVDDFTNYNSAAWTDKDIDKYIKIKEWTLVT